MSYPTLHIELPPANKELLLGLLYDTPMQGCLETEQGIMIYFPPDQALDDVLALLQEWQNRLSLQYRLDSVPHENWNAQWEANFQAIQVEDFVGVRATFHPPFTELEYEIVIQPRMAFGTGHHATTWMMMKLMKSLPLSNTEVLDYGCGTGILAILAALLSAKEIHAVDIEKESFENTILNAQVNQVEEHIKTYFGTLKDVPFGPYDIILANINRNVILASLDTLYPQLKEKGFLLLSGLLLQDEELVHKTAIKAGFTQERRLEKEGWLALQYRK